MTATSYSSFRESRRPSQIRIKKEEMSAVDGRTLLTQEGRIFAHGSVILSVDVDDAVL